MGSGGCQAWPERRGQDRNTESRSQACHSHRCCRREETRRGRERDKGNMHARERQSEKRKGWISWETMIQIEKTSGAMQRRPGETDRSCSGKLKWREDENVGNDKEREKPSHTRGLERCCAFQNYPQHSFKQNTPGLQDTGSWQQGLKGKLKVTSFHSSTLGHHKYNHQDRVQ